MRLGTLFCRSLLWAGLAVGGLCFDCPTAQAGRPPYSVTIERDGKRILEARLQTPNSLQRAEVWEYICWADFAVVGELPLDARKGEDLVLKGPVRVMLRRLGDEVTRSDVEDLRLVVGKDGFWRMTREEVVRTAHNAGLTLPERPDLLPAALAALGVYALAMLASTLWLVRSGRRRPKSDSRTSLVAAA